MYFSNSRWYLYGISSYVISYDGGQTCDNTDPSFFTSVPMYVDGNISINFPGYWISCSTTWYNNKNKICLTLSLSISIFFYTIFKS